MSFYKVPFGAGNRYQFADVPAMSTVIVYLFNNWGHDFRAFIDKIGFGPKCLPWARSGGLRFIWLIDGEVIETFNYQIAEVKKPKQLDTPYIAKKEIEWKVVNETSEAHYCEVLCDGVLVMKPSSKARYYGNRSRKT